MKHACSASSTTCTPIRYQTLSDPDAHCPHHFQVLSTLWRKVRQLVLQAEKRLPTRVVFVVAGVNTRFGEGISHADICGSSSCDFAFSKRQLDTDYRHSGASIGSAAMRSPIRSVAWTDLDYVMSFSLFSQMLERSSETAPGLPLRVNISDLEFSHRVVDCLVFAWDPTPHAGMPATWDFQSSVTMANTMSQSDARSCRPIVAAITGRAEEPVCCAVDTLSGHIERFVPCQMPSLRKLTTALDISDLYRTEFRSTWRRSPGQTCVGGSRL